MAWYNISVLGIGYWVLGIGPAAAVPETGAVQIKKKEASAYKMEDMK